MLKLEEIQADNYVQGIEPNQIVQIIRTKEVGDPDSLTVYYEDSSGAMGNRLLRREDEAGLSIGATGSPWLSISNSLWKLTEFS